MAMTTEDAIKNRYTQMRRAFYPSYTPNDKASGAAWDTAADLVRSINADPDMFVESQFESFSTRTWGERFPWPAQLHAASAADIYAKYIENRTSTPDAMLSQQNELLAAQLTQESCLDQIDLALASSVLDFKSWFRILMCSDSNFPKFRTVWGSAAVRQVRGSPVLQRFLKTNYESRINRFS